MEMVGSRATRSSIVHKFVMVDSVVASATVNRPNNTPLLGKVNFDIDVPPRPNLILLPPRTGNAQAPPLRVLTSLPIERPELPHGFGILKENLETQGVNDFLKGIYNIVQQQNYKAINEILFHLEESLHHTQPHENSTQKVVSRRNSSTQNRLQQREAKIRSRKTIRKKKTLFSFL